MADQATCGLCGEPMPPGEEMFKFHGYSGPCPVELQRALGPPVDATDAIQINRLARAIRTRNHQWWTDLHTGQSLQRNVGELLMLIVSEVAEAMEGHRKNLPDDKLPHRSMLEVELADAVIRILDMAGGMGLDLGGAIVEKLAYNATRHDHTREGRLAAGGKAY